MENSSSSQGMSRAAKKRAKKKHKQIQPDVEPAGATTQKKRVRVDAAEPTNLGSAAAAAVHDEYAVDSVGSDDDYDHGDKGKDRGKSNEKEDKKQSDNGSQLNDDNEQFLLPSCKRLLDLVTTEESSDESVLSSLTSEQRARAILQFLLKDVSLGEFYQKYWEKRPLCVQQQMDSHDDHVLQRFQGLLSKARIQTILESSHPTYYGRDISITRYEKGSDGEKRTLIGDLTTDWKVKEGEEIDPADTSMYVQVDANELWKRYAQGYSVRLICPHQHAVELHSLVSLLELEWGCKVGINVLLSPPGEGCPPRYENAETFHLQMEGYRRWKVYPPRSKAEELPIASSDDLNDEDFRDSKPILDVVLGPGDTLHLPRGWIHQSSVPKEKETKQGEGHSLHLTICAMQNWSWAEFMEFLLPEALQAAIQSESSTLLRTGLPRNFLNYMGAMHDNRDEDIPEVLKKLAVAVKDESEKATALLIRQQQDKFREETKKRIMRVANEAMTMVDAVCDEMGKRFQFERPPPSWTSQEKELLSKDEQILPDRLCRLARPGVARLVLEDGKAVVYHCIDNSCVYEKELSPLEFEVDDAPAIEQLLTTVEPQWICVSDLIHDSIEDKVGVAQALYDEGILALRPGTG